MFLQWCRDVLLVSFIFVQRYCFGDRTRLRKGTTAETQTLVAIWLGSVESDTLDVDVFHDREQIKEQRGQFDNTWTRTQFADE